MQTNYFLLLKIHNMMQETLEITSTIETPYFGFEIKDPELICSSDHNIQRICINLDCQRQALICEEISCDTCGKQAHMFCPSVRFRSLTYLLQQRAARQQEFYSRACEIEKELHKLIRESIQKLTRLYSVGELNEKYLKIIQEIYKNNNPYCMISPQAQDLWRRLQREGETSREQGETLLLSFKNSTRTFVETVLQPINRNLKIQREFGFNYQSQMKINSEVITSSLIKSEERKSGSSYIIQTNAQLIEEQMTFLLQALGKPKSLNLLFRGSRDGFTAAEFHKKCDNIINTLVLVRTEYGKTIAGFTESPWNAVANNYVHGTNKKCFLLSLDLREKMVPNEQSYLTYCHPNYGPTFGKYSHDLSIADQCNANRNSQANFPHCFNREGGDYKYKNQQATYLKFCGSSLGCNFRVLDYEVFKVVY